MFRFMMLTGAMITGDHWVIDYELNAVGYHTCRGTVLIGRNVPDADMERATNLAADIAQATAPSKLTDEIWIGRYNVYKANDDLTGWVVVIDQNARRSWPRSLEDAMAKYSAHAYNDIETECETMCLIM